MEMWIVKKISRLGYRTEIYWTEQGWHFYFWKISDGPGSKPIIGGLASYCDWIPMCGLMSSYLHLRRRHNKDVNTK